MFLLILSSSVAAVSHVDDLLGLLDEREHVAHAEQPGDEAIGVEGLEVLEPLAGADKRNRHADHRDHRQRRAAAGVAVDLRQHHAGDADLAVELAGALDGVLPGHRVGDVEQVGGLDHVLDRDQLGHQLVVDVQPAGGVDDDDVAAGVAGLGHRAAGPRHRVEVAGRVEHPHAGLLADDRQLLDGGGTADVGGDDDRMPALTGQHQRQLAGGGGLARALQAEHQDHARVLRGLHQAALGIAEQRQQLVADDLDDLLRRRQAALHRLVVGAIAHPIDERLDDLQVDVGLEQRGADVAQHALGRLGGEADIAPQRLEDVLEPGAQGVEHGLSPGPPGARRPETRVAGALRSPRRKPLSYASFGDPVKPQTARRRVSSWP